MGNRLCQLSVTILVPLLAYAGVWAHAPELPKIGQGLQYLDDFVHFWTVHQFRERTNHQMTHHPGQAILRVEQPTDGFGGIFRTDVIMQSKRPTEDWLHLRSAAPACQAERSDRLRVQLRLR